MIRTKIRYYVELNAKFVADFATIRGAVGYIDRKHLLDVEKDNVVRIWDNNGNGYNPINGKEIHYGK